MPLVMFQPSNKNVNVPAGTELLVAARRAGVEIDIPCGGKGTCGKCVVRILSGDVDSDSLGVLPSSAIIDGFVLACKTKVLETSVVVEVPEIGGRKNGKFTDAIEDTTLVRHELMPKQWHYDPLVVKWYVDVEPARLDDGLSDLDRLTRGIQKDWGKRKLCTRCR